MIFSHPGSFKMVSRNVFDSAHTCVCGESHTDLIEIRIMTTVISRNLFVFSPEFLRFIQEFSLSLKTYSAVLHLLSNMSLFQFEDDKIACFHYKQ